MLRTGCCGDGDARLGRLMSNNGPQAEMMMNIFTFSRTIPTCMLLACILQQMLYVKHLMSCKGSLEGRRGTKMQNHCLSSQKSMTDHHMQHVHTRCTFRADTSMSTRCWLKYEKKAADIIEYSNRGISYGNRWWWEVSVRVFSISKCTLRRCRVYSNSGRCQ